MVFSKDRDKFDILLNFMNFFVAESCGNCTPCRAGNVVLRDLILRFQSGHARTEDLEKINQWSKIVSKTSRCGLGATSPNVLTSSLRAFPNLYRDAISPVKNEKFYDFDLVKATADYDQTIESLKMENKNE